MDVPVGVGDVLAESGELTVRRLGRASTWQRTHGGTIERALLSTGALSESVLTAALSQAYGLPGVPRERLMSADPEAVEALPACDRRRLRALPFHHDGTRLQVAVSDARSPVLVNMLKSATGLEIDLFVVPDPVLQDIIDCFEKGEVKHAPTNLPACDTGDESIERLARALLADALRVGATEMVLGSDSRGAFVRMFDSSGFASMRWLSEALLSPLSTWFRGRCFGEGGLVVDGMGGEASQRRRVGLLHSNTGGLSLKIAAIPPPSA